jgi:hypothetical protein
MIKGMGEAAWREKEGLAIRFWEERLSTVPTTLWSDAWLGVSDSAPVFEKET